MIFTVALLAAGGGYFWWQYYQTTPAYSLALLIDAAQRNDLALVEQIVNSDRIVDNLASRIAERTAARYGASLKPAMRKRVEALVPALLPRVKESARPVFAKRVQEMFGRSEPKPFIVLAIGLPYFLEITSEGDEAKVTAPELDHNVELVLRRESERWRIVAINDDVVVERLVDGIISEFPAIGEVVRRTSVCRDGGHNCISNDKPEILDKAATIAGVTTN